MTSKRLKDLVCITVSTKYDDILSIVIHQNQRFFQKWYIITHPDDKATIDLVNKANYSNIELVYFDFYKDATFNKGGAIAHVQKNLRAFHLNKPILILDSDIFLPDEFYDIMIKLKINPQTIYGVTERLDYSSYKDFIENKNELSHPASKHCIGFFQLYRQSYFKNYAQSQNCSSCDSAFKDGFAKKVNLPLTVKHLGKANYNWDGRNTKNDFSMDL